ncbi:MAG: 3-ketoacyl-ACP reductase [Dehalococcoidia bacterium]|nr:3-ketoacyl-ACP reductase [Dehalococcoidia bacterium]
MGRLANKVAIVTGGAQGLGGATARRLAEEGTTVLIADIDDEAAGRRVASIEAAGGIVEAFHADVGSHEDIQAMVAHTLDRWQRLDILVNNAFPVINPVGAGSTLEVSEEGWDRGMAIITKSIFLAAKYAVPAMQEAGDGNIVNISSVHGLLMAPGHMVYEAGKAAVIGLTRQLATEFGPWGIRVNTICPGHMVTRRLQEDLWADNPSGLRFFKQQYPLRRCGRPVDIANAVVFLCSDEAAFITGHALVVDGGLSIQLQENLSVRLGKYLQEHPDTHLP